MERQGKYLAHLAARRPRVVRLGKVSVVVDDQKVRDELRLRAEHDEDRLGKVALEERGAVRVEEVRLGEAALVDQNRARVAALVSLLLREWRQIMHVWIC